MHGVGDSCEGEAADPHARAVNDSLRDKLTELARLVNCRPPDGEHDSGREHSCARGLRLRRCVVPSGGVRVVRDRAGLALAGLSAGANFFIVGHEIDVNTARSEGLIVDFGSQVT